jgi:hypothetical protein
MIYQMPANVTDETLLDPGTDAALRALYLELDAEIAQIGPVCQLSGRCCRFKEYGHTLFASTAEIQLLLGSAPEPCRPLDHGETCPWQSPQGHCTARDCRPLGCRIYYCDTSFELRAYELSERYITRLKGLSDQHRLPWNYAPLHRHLGEALARGTDSTEVANHVSE